MSRLSLVSTVVVRGGGDLATGVIQKFHRAGFHVAVLEIPVPLAIRRSVALGTAVSEGRHAVEDLTAVRVDSPEACRQAWADGLIPVLVDPEAASLQSLRPAALVDAILAKRNLGTHRGMAPITLALGPGFSAPEDVDGVIETMRGHDLGRLITHGSALPNTGIPGEVGGQSARRVVHAPAGGLLRHIRAIGDPVAEGEVLFTLDNIPVPSPLTGILRGLLADGLTVPKGLKCADVDPRSSDHVNWRTISDKARCLGGAALEACLYIARQKNISLSL